VKFAIWQPVTYPALHVAGSPRMSSTQPLTTCSTTAESGDRTWIPAFWSHAETSQSAAVATGTLPPTTKPKKRGPRVATVPSWPAAASRSTTRVGSSPFSGSGPPRLRRSPSGAAAAATGRASTVCRYCCACSAARRSSGLPGATVSSSGWLERGTIPAPLGQRSTTAIPMRVTYAMTSLAGCPFTTRSPSAATWLAAWMVRPR
jgi:hypothetical protein